MVLPGPVFAVKFLGLAQGVYFTHRSRKALNAIKSTEVTESSIGPATWLLAYRAVAFLYALAIGGVQLAKVGRRLFVFFTIWNWWFLTAYFGIGTLLSLRAVLRQRRGQSVEGQSAGALGKALVVMFNIETPLVWVMDLTTWLVLVPMLMAAPDEEKRQYWARIMFSFTSYNQHGFNAVMMLGELALSRVPAVFFMSGYMALWLSAFAAWSTAYYAVTGRFIYPFLDTTNNPGAWMVYAGLFAAFWAAFLAFLGLHWAKVRLLEAAQRRKLERKIQ